MRELAEKIKVEPFSEGIKINFNTNEK